MDDDWDASDTEVVAKPAPTSKATPVAPPPTMVRKKFEGEDEEVDEGSGDDWDASDSEKTKKKAATASGSSTPATGSTVPKKKGTLKAKLAEKEAAKSSGASRDDLIDEETPQEKRRRIAREQEDADLAHAADLLGGATIDDTDVHALLSAKPTSPEEFANLARQIASLMFERHASHPRYAQFATEICKLVVQPCKDVDVRKAATALGVVANEKVQEAKDKASGKKKATAKGKPALGLGKNLAVKSDTAAYDEALDDELDFM